MRPDLRDHDLHLRVIELLLHPQILFGIEVDLQHQIGNDIRKVSDLVLHLDIVHFFNDHFRAFVIGVVDQRLLDLLDRLDRPVIQRCKQNADCRDYNEDTDKRCDFQRLCSRNPDLLPVVCYAEQSLQMSVCVERHITDIIISHFREIS